MSDFTCLLPLSHLTVTSTLLPSAQQDCRNPADILCQLWAYEGLFLYEALEKNGQATDARPAAPETRHSSSGPIGDFAHSTPPSFPSTYLAQRHEVYETASFAMISSLFPVPFLPMLTISCSLPSTDPHCRRAVLVGFSCTKMTRSFQALDSLGKILQNTHTHTEPKIFLAEPN